jgi:Gram-negative porin
MIGGLWKSTSCAALIASAGLFAGVAVPSAKAADLGGDCCADLEERVAELEATTARKGNRRMSLTVSGQVTRSILYWNDGNNSGTYAGLDNHNQSTRFVFSGSAKISPSVTAGFEFMTEWSGGARTSTVNQDSPDGGVSSDGTLNVRTANWWLEDKALGRLTVGRVNVGGPVATIDLGGISTVAHFSPGLVGGAFRVAGTTVLGSVIGPTYGGDRIEGIRYDSANIGGFVGQATWGEDDVWSASLRYAGEHGGFRIAAGIGYEAQDPSATQTVQLDNGARFLDNEWSASLAILHTASGLFAQGHYARSEFLNGTDARFWMIQGGITKNWFGMGNTSLYAEYGEATDFIKSGLNVAASIGTVQVTTGFPTASSDSDFFGLGVVQQIDAAAMEVFLGWRRFDTTVTGHPTAAANGSSDLDLVHGGARIRF